MLVEPLDEGASPLGATVMPCDSFGVLCVHLRHDATNEELDEAVLRTREETTTENADYALDRTLPTYVSGQNPWHQLTHVVPGTYAAMVTKDGWSLAARSEARFRVQAGRYTRIELFLQPDQDADLLTAVDRPIIRHDHLETRIWGDLGGEGAKLPESQCIDFPTLLGILRGLGGQCAEYTLLGVADHLPFSVFLPLRDAFGLHDYAQSSSLLDVSPVDLPAFLGGMHGAGMKVVFLVPPRPLTVEYREKRTSKELRWYLANRGAMAHVTFVFGSYEAISGGDNGTYLSGDRAKERQLLRRYDEFLLPPEPADDEAVRLLGEEREFDAI